MIITSRNTFNTYMRVIMINKCIKIYCMNGRYKVLFELTSLLNPLSMNRVMTK